MDIVYRGVLSRRGNVERLFFTFDRSKKKRFNRTTKKGIYVEYD